MPQPALAGTAATAPGPHVDFDLHGLVGVRLVRPALADAVAIGRQLGLEPTSLSREPDVVVRFVDRLAASGPLIYVGPDAAFDEEAFFLFAGKGGRRARVQISLGRIGEQVQITCERSIGVVPLLHPILSVVMLRKRVLSLHASAFVFRNTGVAILGWPRGGKTSALIGFMAEGAEFVGDDRVYVGEGGENLWGMNQPLEIRAWHVGDRPEYRALLGRHENARLRAADLLSRLERLSAPGAPARSLVGRRWSRVVRSLKQQLSVDVDPRRLFGENTPPSARLDRLFIALTHSGPDVLVEPLDPDEARRRIGYLLRHERLPLTDAYLRFRFAFPQAESSLLERVEELERDALERVLSATPVYTVRHPHGVPTHRLFQAMLPYCAL